MKKLFEVRIPIGPTEPFIRRIHLIAASLRHLGPTMANHEIVVSVGEDVEPYNLYERYPWSQIYPITWRWVNREAYRQRSYWETYLDVFRQHPRADYVVRLDADALVIRDFAALFQQLEQRPAVAGMISWLPPFSKHPESPEEMWRKMFDGYGVPRAPLVHEHTAWELLTHDPKDRYGPPYFNYGFLAAPYSLFDKLCVEVEPADRFTSANMRGNKRTQIAVALALQKHGLDSLILPVRYNFPNWDIFDAKYPEELENVHVIHYPRRDIVDRDRDFQNLGALAALIDRKDLTGSNEILRQRLEELYPAIEEEERL